MPQAPTYDYEAESRAIQRQMQIAEAMQAQGMQPLGPTEMAGGIAVRRSPMEGIAKIAQAYLGRKSFEDAEQKRAALSGRYGADLKRGIGALIDGLGASPGQVTPEVQGNNPSAFVPAQTMSAEDASTAKRNAILEAIGSNHPVLQQLGMSQLAQMQKGGIEAKDLLPYVNPQAIPAMLKHGAAGFVPKQNVKEIGGVLYDADTMKVLKLADGYDPTKQLIIGGDRYQVNPSTGKLEKVDNAPKTDIRVGGATVLGAGQKKLSEAWSSAAVKTVEEMSAAARAGTKVLSSLNQMEELNKQTTMAGPAAAPAMWISGLAKQMGIPIDEAKLNNSATFDSESTRVWAALMQSLGGARGLVKEESEKLADSLPRLTQTPEGRQQIITVLRRAAQQDIANATAANEQLGKAMNADDASLFTFGLQGAQLPTHPPTMPPAGSVAPGARKDQFRVIR